MNGSVNATKNHIESRLFIFLKSKMLLTAKTEAIAIMAIVGLGKRYSRAVIPPIALAIINGSRKVMP